MTIGQKILLALCRKPGSDDFQETRESHLTDESSLALLKRAYPDLSSIIAGKIVVDFGCGTGDQALALARLGASKVIGVDSNPSTLAKARDRLSRTDFQGKLKFVEELQPETNGQIDIVISQNAMEHFPDPVAVLGEMLNALNENGLLLITFGPPWYAPYGSHMHFFTKVPWVNIIFSEKTVMSVRTHFRDDGAKRYEEVESGLNKMSVRKFEQIVKDLGLINEHRKYGCIKRLDFLGRLPFLRELFINHITTVLRKKAN